MKRAFLFPLIVLVLVSLACSVGGRKATETPEAAAPESTQEGAKEAQVEVTSTPQPAKSFEDTFDEMKDAWSDSLLVTTQGAGGKTESAVKLLDGKMVFQFTDKETYLYKFVKQPMGADVVIESSYQAFSQIYNGIAFVCRAKSDYSAWYEFRLSSVAKFAIYRFDQALKDEYKNPYIELASGSADATKLYPTKPNVVKATCKGSTLSLEVNGNSLTSVQDDALQEDGLVGLGAMSQNNLPMSIRFDYIKVSSPD